MGPLLKRRDFLGSFVHFPMLGGYSVFKDRLGAATRFDWSTGDWGV